MSQTTIDNASFRDPDSAVIYDGGRVFRGLRGGALEALRSLEKSGLLDNVCASGRVISTRFLVENEPSYASLMKTFPGFAGFVEHPFLPFVSYPPEWTMSMLCDAALLHLDLQMELIEKGFSLKDASAYNVQFDGSRAVFIDAGSFEVGAGAVWPAYGQFCRMFLFPLLLWRYRHMEPKGLFLSHMDGVPLRTTAEILGVRALYPSCFLDVTLPARLEKRANANAARVDFSGGDVRVQQANLNRLKRIIRRLYDHPNTSSQEWVEYNQSRLYSPAEIERKKSVVRRFLESHKPKTVLDAGSNTGEFSFLAAEAGARVIAVDSDHDATDALYRRARNERQQIHPIWMDLANPTPGYGHASMERSAFTARTKVDAVFALAILHHLILSAGLPVDHVAQYLWGFGSTSLLLEHISPEDPQIKTMTRFRTRDLSDFTEGHVIRSFERYGKLIARETITPFRTLFLFSRA